MASWVCPNCKTKLDPEYAFCPECGTRIEASQDQSDTDSPETSDSVTESELEADLVAGLQEELETAGEEQASDEEPEGEAAGEGSVEPEVSQSEDAAEPEPPPSEIEEPAVSGQPEAQPEIETAEKEPAPVKKAERPKGLTPGGAGFRIIRLARGGGTRAEYEIPARGLVIGRVNVDVSFPDDQTVSPRHATLRPSGTSVDLEDSNSLNGLFTRLKSEHHLTEGDTFMCGDQVFRFSVRMARFHTGDFRLYAAPQEKMVQATLTHILGEGNEGEIYPIRASSFRIGRDEGDVRFGADRFMSRKHSIIKKADKGFVLVDQKSRNGTYICRRGTLALVDGDIFMIGRQMLRLEVVA